MTPVLQEDRSHCLGLALETGVHSLDFGRDFEVPHARGRELPGVDVGDLLQGAVDVLDVVTFHHQDGLRGVEMVLENSRGSQERMTNRVPSPREPLHRHEKATKGSTGNPKASASAAAVHADCFNPQATPANPWWASGPAPLRSPGITNTHRMGF